MRLDERKYMILQAIIDDYITTAVPVGSRTISRKAGVSVSPATIRNEMSDLEELGYLDQPHTSAGRVPSLKAYRLYVDHLMKTVRLNNVEAEQMHEHLTERTQRVETVIRSAANLLADATKYTSVIVSPRLSTMRIRRVQLVPVNEHKALMVIITNAGLVKDAVVHVPEELDDDGLYAVSRVLTQRLADKPLEAVRQTFAEMLKEGQINRRLLGETLNVIEQRLDMQDAADIIVGGSTNLLNYPEYADIHRAMDLLNALESPKTLYKLVRRDDSREINIHIGPENGVPELSDCSVVTAHYSVADTPGGTLAIVGPTRMNYNRVIAVLEFMGQALSEVLANRT